MTTILDISPEILLDIFTRLTHVQDRWSMTDRARGSHSRRRRFQIIPSSETCKTWRDVISTSSDCWVIKIHPRKLVTARELDQIDQWLLTHCCLVDVELEMGTFCRFDLTRILRA